MNDYQRWDEDGRFALSCTPRCSFRDNGDFGTGSGLSVMYFGSNEAREYFIMLTDARNGWEDAVLDLASFKAALADCFTPSGRVRRKRLMQLAGREA